MRLTRALRAAWFAFWAEWKRDTTVQVELAPVASMTTISVPTNATTDLTVHVTQAAPEPRFIEEPAYEPPVPIVPTGRLEIRPARRKGDDVPKDGFAVEWWRDGERFLWQPEAGPRSAGMQARDQFLELARAGAEVVLWHDGERRDWRPR